jgi:mannose-6-phosphate isomerase-like protein (cupin superfamily)
MFFVIDGTGTIVVGGSLVEDRRTGAVDRLGTSIQGGASRRVAKGDFVMVPENTAHWFSTIDGSLVLMSLHLPKDPSH